MIFQITIRETKDEHLNFLHLASERIPSLETQGHVKSTNAPLRLNNDSLFPIFRTGKVNGRMYLNLSFSPVFILVVH